jgi:hypothetical protein
MPSRNASRVVIRLEQFLGRKLSNHEVILCEEMVYNVYVNAVTSYIDRLSKKKVARTFAAIYFPIINGTTKNAWKRNDVYHMTPHVEKLYWRLHDLLEPNFSEHEFEHILWLADVEEKELDDAISFIRARGIHSAAYMRAMILQKRERERKEAPKQAIASVLPNVALRPAVDLERSRTSWKRKAEIAEVELHARYDTADKAEGSIK